MLCERDNLIRKGIYRPHGGQKVTKPGHTYKYDLSGSLLDSIDKEKKIVFFYKLEELDEKRVNIAFSDALFIIKKSSTFKKGYLIPTTEVNDYALDAFQDMMVGSSTFKRTYVINRVIDSVIGLHRAYQALGCPDIVNFSTLIQGCNKNVQKYLRNNNIFEGKLLGNKYTRTYKAYNKPCLYKNGVSVYDTDSTCFEKIMNEIESYNCFEFCGDKPVKLADIVKIRYRIKSMLNAHKSCSRKTIKSKIRTILNSPTIDVDEKAAKKIIEQNIIISKVPNIINIYDVLRILLVDGAISFTKDSLRKDRRRASLERGNNIRIGSSSIQKTKVFARKIKIVNIDYSLRKRLKKRCIICNLKREIDYKDFECVENLLERIGIFRC